MKHLLAPVPADHLPDALRVGAEQGSVLLGSNQFELLMRLRGQAVTVWLVASTGYLKAGVVPPVNIGKVLARGRFVDYEEADRRGRPKRPGLRPPSTAGDGAWHMFYEVADLEEVTPPIPSASLRAAGGGHIEVAPHMLLLIEAPSR